MEVKTSSGLVAEVKHLTGEEMRELQRGANTKGFHPMTYALQKCVTVKSPGVYKQIDDFGRLYSGDRFHLYHKIREATKGPVFKFKINCPVQGCKSKIAWTVNLHELENRPLSDEHKKALNGKNEFTESLEGYGEVKVKYTDGYDELRLMDDTEKYDSFTAMVLSQVISVGENSGQAALLRLMNEESMDLTDKLLLICQKYEFGPETSIDIECRNPRCKAISTVQMPSDLRFFFDAIGGIS